MSEITDNIKAQEINQDCSALESENKRLHKENQRLAHKAEDVAIANAYAAELMVKIEEANDNLKIEIEKRKVAEQKLRQINLEIEETVQQRTAELTSTNERLIDEIKQREQIEQTLREHKQRLDTILSVILTGVIIVDSETHNIIDVNPLAAKMIGLPKEQIINKICHKFICPAEEGKCPISDLGQTVDNSERVLLRPNGKDISILKNVAKSFWQGREYLVESFIDINELKKAEEELQEINEKLVSMNQQLQEFIYVATHDLKEPLRKVSAFGDMLKESLGGTLNEDQKENFDFVISGADRMKQIVNSLLAYSKVINKDPEINEIDLSKEINGIKKIGLSSLQKETSGILRIQEPLPVVQGDQVQIRQVFDNLIGNALKYCKKDVPPEIIVRAFRLDNGMVRIEVEDNGIGIKPEYYENIFAIFRRLNTGHEYEGIGIGLAICKRIIEKHGGDIGVNSTFGHGSIFWFTLPSINASEKEQDGLILSTKA